MDKLVPGSQVGDRGTNLSDQARSGWAVCVWCFSEYARVYMQNSKSIHIKRILVQLCIWSHQDYFFSVCFYPFSHVPRGKKYASELGKLKVEING